MHACVDFVPGIAILKQYLVPWARYGTPNPIVLDEGARKDLWTWLEEQVDKFNGQ